MTKDEALKMAIETFEFEGVRNEEGLNVLNACKEALEQQPQEPVAMYENGNVNWINTPKDNSPLYTHPAPSWQGLSEEEIIEKCAPIWGAIINTRDREETVDFARAIEQALKEKNG